MNDVLVRKIDYIFKNFECSIPVLIPFKITLEVFPYGNFNHLSLHAFHVWQFNHSVLNACGIEACHELEEGGLSYALHLCPFQSLVLNACGIEVCRQCREMEEGGART